MNIQKSIASTVIAAAAVVMSSCAANQVAQVKRPASGCPMNFVLYCEVRGDFATPGEACRCVRQRAIADALRNF